MRGVGLLGIPVVLMGFGLPDDRIHGLNESSTYTTFSGHRLFLRSWVSRQRTTTVESPPRGRVDAARGGRNDY